MDKYLKPYLDLVLVIDEVELFKFDSVPLSSTTNLVGLLTEEEYENYDRKSKYDRKFKKNLIIKTLNKQDSIYETETVGDVNKYLNNILTKIK